MTLRKITIENSVRYVSKDGHSCSKQIALISKERKKNFSIIKLSENIRKFIKNKTGEKVIRLK